MQIISKNEFEQSLIESARREFLRRIKIHVDKPMKKGSKKQSPKPVKGGMKVKMPMMKSKMKKSC